ncbi:two-component system sensor histidine kinase CreC [Acanthopleuribacter pedis]
MKVRTRMILAFIAMVAAGFFYLLHRIDESVRPIYLVAVEDDMIELATLLSSDISRRSEEGTLVLEGFRELISHAMWRRFEAVIYDRTKDRIEFGVYVVDHNGIVVFDSLDDSRRGQDYSEWIDVRRTLTGQYGARATWEDDPQSPGDRVQVFYVASPIVVEGRVLGAVTVYKTTSKGFSYFLQVRRETMRGAVLVSLLVLGWGLMITHWVNRPIQQLTEYAQTIRDGGRAATPMLGSKDMESMARAFDEMREALEGKAYVEQYVQTLTHEIKSPLSAIRGAAELLEEPMTEERHAAFVANIRGESARIQQLVDRLLELSAIENRKGLRQTEPIALDDLVHEILDELSPVIETKHLRVNFEADPAKHVKGERFLLKLALRNLVQNACEFTPTSGGIHIYYRACSLHIHDDGPGIPDYAANRVFERFYSLQRPETGKKSSGLGLSIVRQVADLHQGEVHLRNHAEGGAEAVFVFRPA